MEVDETVSMALMTAMERLSPAERAALLLHDVFDHDYAEVAAVLDRNEAACRQLVSRARRRVRRPERERSVAAEQHRRLLNEFLQAAASADYEGLKRVLREDVAFHSDGGGKAVAAGKVLMGADVVARFFVGVVQRSGGRFDREVVNWCWYNGAPGAVIVEDGRAVTAFCLRVEDGRIAELYALRNPDKLVGFAGLIP
jgi:RNA polymerase sigma-70 factor (ECF subfamily)